MQTATEVSPWSGVPGWRLELEFRDLMHTGPLGILRDLIASGLNDLLEAGALGAHDPKDMLLRGVWVEMQSFLENHGIGKVYGPPVFSLNTLGLDVISNTPTMSSLYKAAHLSHMCIFFVNLFNKHTLDARGELRAACMWGYTNFIYVPQLNVTYFRISPVAWHLHKVYHVLCIC